MTPRETLDAVALRLHEVFGEDGEGNTVFGIIEDKLNRVVSHDEIMAMINAAPRNPSGTVKASPEYTCFRAVSDVQDMLSNSVMMVEVLRSSITNMQSILASALVVTEAED